MAVFPCPRPGIGLGSDADPPDSLWRPRDVMRAGKGGLSHGQEAPTWPTGTKEEQARRARADFEERIYRRSTDTSAADPVLALPAPGRATATPACGHVRLYWEPVDGAAGYLIERADPDGEPRLVSTAAATYPRCRHAPFADTGCRGRRRLPLPGRRRGRRRATRCGTGGARRRHAYRTGGPSRSRSRVDAATPDSAPLDRVWQHGRLRAAHPAALGRRRARQRHRRGVRGGAPPRARRTSVPPTSAPTRSCTTTTTW